MSKRRRIANVRCNSKKGSNESGDQSASCNFLFSWDPTRVFPSKPESAAPSGETMEVETPSLAPAPAAFTFNAPAVSSGMAPTFSFLALGVLPSQRTPVRSNRCTRGPCPASGGSSWRPKGVRRVRRVSYSPLRNAEQPEDELETCCAMGPAEEASRLASGEETGQCPIFEMQDAEPAAAAVEVDPFDRMITLLCELINGISLTSACVPIAKRRTMDHAMLIKRIDALCTELEHQFDTINTLRNLADEAPTEAERQWLQQQRERVDAECAAIEQEIQDIKTVLGK